MKKIRETLEPWGLTSIFARSKTPESDDNISCGAGGTSVGGNNNKPPPLSKNPSQIFDKPRAVARLLSKSPSNEGFYVVNPKPIDNNTTPVTEVFTPLDFDIDALYAVPKKRNSGREQENARREHEANNGTITTIDKAYANVDIRGKINGIQINRSDGKTTNTSKFYANLNNDDGVQDAKENLADHQLIQNPEDATTPYANQGEGSNTTLNAEQMNNSGAIDGLNSDGVKGGSDTGMKMMIGQERSYVNLSESRYQPLSIRLGGEELHYQIVKPRPLRCKRSKSAQNLHKTELKVFLQRAPSLEQVANNNDAAAMLYDVPGSPKPVVTSQEVTTSASGGDLTRQMVLRSGDSAKTTRDIRHENRKPAGIENHNICQPSDKKSLSDRCKSNDTIITKDDNQNIDSDCRHGNGNVMNRLDHELTDGVKSTDQKVDVTNSSQIEIKVQNEDGGDIESEEDFYQVIDNNRVSSDSSVKILDKNANKNDAEEGSVKNSEINQDNNNDNCNNIRLGTKLIKIEHLQNRDVMTTSHHDYVVIDKPLSDLDDMSSYVSYEYCEEKNQLKEPRLLSRSRTGPLHVNSAKISKAWRGLKGFLEDEKRRLDKLVAKQRSAACAKMAAAAGSIGGGSASIAEDKSCVAGGTGVAVGSSDVLVKNEVFFQQLNDQASNGGVNESADQKDGKFEGQNGYEELRRHVKAGGDLNKELATILQERADAELTYAKSMCKLSGKLSRACRECPAGQQGGGGVALALRGVAADMEARADVHRQFSTSLSEEIVRPLRQLADAQHRARKAAEGACEKSARGLAEWRSAEAKAKKQSHAAARDNEKLQDASLDARLARAPSMAAIPHHYPQQLQQKQDQTMNNNKQQLQAEKDGGRLEAKRKKAEQAVRKADVEYYTLCVRAERARLDWELCVCRGCAVLEALEQQRVVQLHSLLRSYCELTAQCGPSLQQCAAERLRPAVEQCDPEQEMQQLRAIRRSSDSPCEQLLPDFYCEHTTLAMNRERRKQALVKLLQLVRQDLNRERKSRVGLENLSQALKQTAAFGSDESQQNVADKLYHIRCMLLYLEGARYKLHSALCELDHRTRGDHPLAPHLRVTRDRTGLQQSVLRAPAWMRETPPVEAACGGDLTAPDATPTTPPMITATNKPLTTAAAPNGAMRGGGDSAVKNGKHHRRHHDDDVSDDDDEWGVDDDEDDDVVGGGRGAGDGLSNQRDSDYDEFSSQGSFNDPADETEHAIKSPPHGMTSSAASADQTDCNNLQQEKLSVTTDGDTAGAGSANNDTVLGHCKAMYEYTPKLYDELSLRPGDVIGVLSRQEDGWWVGRLVGTGRVGIFPATYVQELRDDSSAATPAAATAGNGGGR